MKRFYLVICILLKTASAFCQEELFHFKIEDEKSSLPIRFCYVVVKGSSISSQTDEKGDVTIKAGFADTLVIYQLGYYTTKTTLHEIIKHKQVVLLRPKNLVLDEVVVNAMKTNTLQADNNTTFVDFDFYDDFILALANKGKKHNSILLLDMDGKKISESNPSIASEKVFKDCFGNIHLLCKDSIYQVYYDYNKLRLLSPFPISDYYQVLKPCECNNGHNYIFKISQYRNLKNAYYLFDEQQHKQLIATIADSSAIKGFNMDFDINYFLSRRRNGLGYNTSVSELNKHIDQLREELVLPEEYTNLLRPVDSEAQKVDSVFVLMDYTHKVMTVFSETGIKLKDLSLSKDIDILPKMYYDGDQREIIFAAQNKSGLLTLYKFDMSKSKYTHQFTVNNFYFIKGLKIKGGNLFFIYKDRSSDMVRKKIVKEPIVWRTI